MIRDAMPGDLVRPKKNMRVSIWNDVIRDEMGGVRRMDKVIKGRHLSGVNIVVNSDNANRDALLLWSTEDQRLVWTWRNYVVIMNAP